MILCCNCKHLRTVTRDKLYWCAQKKTHVNLIGVYRERECEKYTRCEREE